MTAPVTINDKEEEATEDAQTPEVRVDIYSKDDSLHDPSIPKDDKEDEEETCCDKAKSWTAVICKVTALLGLLYIFICTLSLLSDGFILLGGRTASELFKNSELLRNPVAGLMIGVVFTAAVQSSSTSTSVVVTMIAADLLDVRMSIPIIMGANIGTSITGIIVAVTQSGDRLHFQRAFSGATVHDMFNWLSVLIFLPLEVATGYLFYLTTAIVESAGLTGGGESQEFLTVLTKPLTQLIVQVDKSVLDEIASDNPEADSMSLLKYWCKYEYVTVNATAAPLTNQTESYNVTMEPEPTAYLIKQPVEECHYLFHDTGLSETVVGTILLVSSLIMLIAVLIGMVKLLNNLLSGSMAKVINKTINADFPGKAASLTGYFAILIGAAVTLLVQSSSVVTSALTPLVGIGVVSLERVYPMMLGANIGTTSTAVLASFAASGDQVAATFQLALCHLFFNLSGILLWYVIPPNRKAPLGIARWLGKTVSNYRWFAAVYLIGMFLVLPLAIFALSLPGWEVLAGVGIPIVVLLIAIGIMNILQCKAAKCLPEVLRTWDFLPECMRSLAPYDRMFAACKCCQCCNKKGEKEDDAHDIRRSESNSSTGMGTINGGYLSESHVFTLDKDNFNTPL